MVATVWGSHLIPHSFMETIYLHYKMLIKIPFVVTASVSERALINSWYRHVTSTATKALAIPTTIEIEAVICNDSFGVF